MIEKHLNLLGYRARDCITNVEGVVTSICFDLFGCIQACVNPGLDKDGKQRDLFWYDVARLTVLETQRVMEMPSFLKAGPVAQGLHGPESKPSPHSN